MQINGTYDFERSYWLGYLTGVLNGMSLRDDLPSEVREKCKQIVAEYKKWSDAWEDSEMLTQQSEFLRGLHGNGLPR